MSANLGGIAVTSTSKRVAELRKEMAQLRDEDRKYWKSAVRHHPASIVAYENRITRMKQVIDEPEGKE